MLAAVLLVASSASAGDYRLNRALNQVTAGETFAIAADWVDPGPDGFTVGLVLSNVTANRALALRKDELGCARGETWGRVDAGDGPLALGPGESKTLIVTCTTGRGAAGPFVVEVVEVFDDPERFGQPTDAILFERVAWELADDAVERKLQKLPAGFVPRVTAHPTP